MVWLIGILGALLALAGLALLARGAWRRSVRAELRRYVQTHLPEVRIAQESGTELRFAGGALDGVHFNLANLYFELSQSGEPALQTEEGRAEVYRRYFDAALEQTAAARAPLSLPEVQDRLLPMLVPSSFADALSEHGPLPRRSVEGVGLEVVYVLDHPEAVQYLNEGHRSDLGISEEALHTTALENLRARFDSSPVRTALAGNVAAIMSGDGFDATRLLLVPEHLDSDEALAAVAAQRDALVLAPLPADDDWSDLRQMARSPASDRVVSPVPLRVTARGFEPA